MRIEKIELIGFKSFADRTSFILHPGITCIVGPNGCGKSNIVDAFRWVLGEQSAKSLRGDKMEEVIFNGSATKKPKGMAEATMVISGLNGVSGGNGQGGEENVAISRRLYRSGESEYLVNRNSCRLKDIRDIFLDTGLEVKSYSILEQGRIGQIIESRPLDRRFIIEEVAGVMKYKVRKAEALSKLESSRLNLSRVSDIIAEVRKQINILDRLAKKAERYKKLTSELHAIELKISRMEYHDLTTEFEKIMAECSALREDEASRKAELANVENRTQTRRVELIDREKALEQIQKEYHVLEREISEIERSVAVCRNDIGNMEEYEQRIVRQREEADALRDELSHKCEDLVQGIDRLTAELESQVEALRGRKEHLVNLEESLTDRENQLEDKRREIFRRTEELSNTRNELNKQLSALDALDRREAAASRDSEDARRVLAEIESSIGAVETEIHAKNNEFLSLQEKKERLHRELSQGRLQQENLQQKLAQLREEVASLLSRLDSLKEIVLDTPTRDILSSGSDVNILASLSEILDVDAEYEKAVESALAEKADSFILPSHQDVERAVASLKNQNIGRTAFVVPRDGVEAADTPSGGGIVGRALEFVRVREGYDAVAGSLLGNVVIVRDLSSAFALGAEVGSHVFVSIDGEVLEPSGAVVVGEGKGIFRRKRQMRELDEAIRDKKAETDACTRDIAAANTLIAEKEEAIRIVDVAINSIEKEISLSKLTIENYTEDKERNSRRLAYVTIELEEIAKEKELLGRTIGEHEAQLREAESRRSAAENESENLIAGIASIKTELDQVRGEVTDMKLAAASNREKLESLKHELATSRRSLEEMERRRESFQSERESVLSRIAERKSEIGTHEEKLKKIVSEANVMQSDISSRKDEIEAENTDLLGVEQGLRGLRQKIGEINGRIAELDVKRAEHKLRIENIVTNTRNNFGMEIDSVALEEVSEDDRTRLSELKAKVEEMGPVNLGTLEEYEELRSRYDFMTRQQEDLNQSIAELEEAITKINSTTRKKLREAFEALKVKFAEVFVTLFGGGRAELVLTDESNILETGIDIVAQPPGKKLQNILLLSGGEKALTALSLLFASFLIKPTPLCILDEADAPLDESNTERFSRMISELSAETQFIIVTHNKTTMNIAQHLYGITMEEAGVSKVISMQLAEA